MNEFELFFDENKKEWRIKYIIVDSIPKIEVSIQFLINPSEDEKLFWNGKIYQAMLKWLEKEHQEFFI